MGSVTKSCGKQLVLGIWSHLTIARAMCFAAFCAAALRLVVLKLKGRRLPRSCFMKGGLTWG